ncbi:hypothetical protein RchiOBHm_Chr6g0290621 [Rosa chinensis]|uniref:Uncharacterized protein n=1 Tax=Rosa chinensis TaxID=74649 RepID=A0A2P6PVZ0_ROSCH|nr:hypothetical protein RchiOBHm_Chr6g0290621 [Rosa chinensis]
MDLPNNAVWLRFQVQTDPNRTAPSPNIFSSVDDHIHQDKLTQVENELVIKLVVSRSNHVG